MPGFEIVQWDETNTPMGKSEYVRWCAENKQWAFLSDYVKADVLAEHGGVFLDADVVAHRSLESFLMHRAFSGFECRKVPFTAVWASEAGHPWPLAAREYLDTLNIETFDKEPNTGWMSRLLEERFGLDPLIDTYQEGSDGVAIYPSETFCLGAHVGWTSHLFAGSWLPEGARGHYGVNLNDRREAALRLEMSAPDLAIEVARLVAYGDERAAKLMVSSRGKWVSERLPEHMGFRLATQTVVHVGRYVTSLYLHGLKRALGAARQTR